MANSDTTTIR